MKVGVLDCDNNNTIEVPAFQNAAFLRADGWLGSGAPVLNHSTCVYIAAARLAQAGRL